MEEKKKTCCICGNELEESGENPSPVREETCYCRQCNNDLVRFKQICQKLGINPMAKQVYISGAIAHYDMTERKKAFAKAEETLTAQGYNPVNPFKNGLPDEAHWREHMRADIALLLACDYIYMLKDWELSKGAKLELDVASSCGIKVLFE